MGPIVTAVILLIVVGVLLWVVETYLPIDATFKMLIKAVVIIGAVVYLIRTFFPSVLSF